MVVVVVVAGGDQGDQAFQFSYHRVFTVIIHCNVSTVITPLHSTSLHSKFLEFSLSSGWSLVILVSWPGLN